jgi:hypothetical protein
MAKLARPHAQIARGAKNAKRGLFGVLSVLGDLCVRYSIMAA